MIHSSAAKLVWVMAKLQYELTTATGNVIEVEEVVDIYRRADIFRCVSIINNSSVESSYVVPTLIAEREREREYMMET